jgi:Zn-finger nucleic acid-binding protein
MTKLEIRFPCPVCLGVTLQKSSIEGQAAFVLDHCTRCGGAWFDAGEVGRLRLASPEDLWQHIAQRDDVHAMQCHSCNTLLHRDQAHCNACGWRVTLDCPECNQPMETGSQAGVTLDACRRCKGVWFDHHELAAIWNTEFSAALERRGTTAADAGGTVLEALAWDPFSTFYIAHAAGHVISGAASAAPAVAEAASEAAASLFETIVEIISGIFG